MRAKVRFVNQNSLSDSVYSVYGVPERVRRGDLIEVDVPANTAANQPRRPVGRRYAVVQDVDSFVPFGTVPRFVRKLKRAVGMAA